MGFDEEWGQLRAEAAARPVTAAPQDEARRAAWQLDAFCERWGWGVRTLVQQANVSAAHVGLSAGMVHEQDQYVQGGFKVLANAVAGGSPYASEQDVIAKDWGDVLSANPYTNLRDPDYSPVSFAESKEKERTAI
ncbi:hypothetical protein [Streptomyces sp. NPDC029003]|uniref:hypothetical protein n=1 Tax=Streptomyces sp. NPDC029003 TaxID=3155125 RepID=UPI0033E66233